MQKWYKNLWFQDPKAKDIFINETAVRIRAGMLLAIPIFLSYTLYNAVFGSHWIVDGNTIKDTFETDFDEHIIYSGQMIRKTYDYTIQSWVLTYAFFEMIVSMFVKTSYLSPTIWIASFLARNKQPVWKPLVPKRYAWTIGASFIALCWVFFNPDKFAYFVNGIAHTPTKHFFAVFKLLDSSNTCLGMYWFYVDGVSFRLVCWLSSSCTIGKNRHIKR